MLNAPVMNQLHSLGLRGMASALERQQQSREIEALSFDERLTLLLQHEMAARQSTRLAQRLRWARLPQPACVEDIDARTPRGVQLRACRIQAEQRLRIRTKEVQELRGG